MTSITVHENTTERYQKVKLRYTQYKKKWKIPHDEFVNHLLDLLVCEIREVKK